MFNNIKIQTGLKGLVGIRQPLNPDYAFLDSELVASKSGLYLDDLDMFKVEYFKDTQDFKDATDVQLNGKLKQMEASAISSVCSGVFSTPDLVDRAVLYTHSSDRNETETQIAGSFYGYKLELSELQNIAFKITQIRLEFDGTGDLELRLYNSQIPTPLFTKAVTINEPFELVNLDWVIDSTMGDNKGEYYFGYVVNPLLRPFKRNVNDSNVKNVYNNLEVEQIRYDDFNGFTDNSKILEHNENIGINPDITVFSDYTDLILQNSFMFSKAIQLQWGINVMNSYVSSHRANRDQRIAKEMIVSTLQVIEGVKIDDFYKQGLRSILSKEISRILDEINKLKQSYFGRTDSLQVQTLS